MEHSDTVPALRAQCLKRPDSFAMWEDHGREWFTPNGWGFSPIGTHRDADALTRSNWEVITTDLFARFPDAFATIHTGHWAVGWYDHLAVDTSSDGAMLALAEWCNALDDYPVADESHFSDLEYTEACDFWAGMSVADRVDAIQRHGRDVSIFAARREELPRDDSGSLFEYLRGI